ncbi:MAG: T9SS type A sorting domain-containing protein [Bacteroidota bacterium]
MKTFLSIIVFSFVMFNLAAQDTLRYMQYNLMDYSIPFVNCNDNNNAILKKNNWLKTIVSAVNPDIMAVNEMGANTTSVKLLLDSVMNKAGTRVYKSAAIANPSGSPIISMVYYDPAVVKLKSQDVVIDFPRDFPMYKFYLNTMDLGTALDTVFFTVILAHLKAGNTSSDSLQRSGSATKLIDYMNGAYPQGNYILSGDLNLYTSYEQAWQTLTNQTASSHNFFDPANQNGDWSGSQFFANLHTQSTHSDNDGCHASGGMNDRFDFVLVSGNVLAGASGLKALTDTYKALGQDGNHLNLALNTNPPNTSVSPNLLAALYGNSDHLPIIMDLETEKHLSINDYSNTIEARIIENPVADKIQCSVKGVKGDYTFEIFSLMGQSLFKVSKTLSQGNNMIEIPVQQFKSGSYLLRISDQKNYSTSLKFVVSTH